MTKQNNKANRAKKTGKDVLPTEGDIPTVSYVKNPFKNNQILDLHYKDPEKNQHGIITIMTLNKEKAHTYDRNEELRIRGEELKDARDVGVYERDAPEGDRHDFYQEFEVIIAGNSLPRHEVSIALDKLSKHYGSKFYYLDPDEDNPIDALPKIERLCEVCGERVPEEQLEMVEKGDINEWRKDKRVCSEKCRTITQL